MAKIKRKFIRIAGKLKGSPREYLRMSPSEAKKKIDEWYSEKLKEKDFIEKGLLSSHVPTFMSYCASWIRRRMENYPKATWYSDEIRLRKYLLPYLSEFPMDRITRTQMREVLLRCQSENKLSIETRTRIKALASKIFNDALNENPPLVAQNPCSRLQFNDPRRGEKLPPTLEDDDEVLSYLRTAREISELHFLIALIGVGAGLRKSEMIPLRYRSVKIKRCSIVVECRVEQASLSIIPGSKAGSEETREVFVSNEVIEAIKDYRESAKFNGENDFIFCDEDGEWIRPRKFHDIVDAIVKKFERPITLHKLRHSYGRIFATKTGNLRALQDMLGHKSSATTAIYSKLSGNQLAPFAAQMSYGIETTKGKKAKATRRKHQ